MASVQALALIGTLRDGHRCTRSQRSFAATTVANRQLLLAVDAIKPLPVHLEAFPM